MNEIVVITGQMRSGTSLAACILHRLGWFAGTYLSAPMPPSWRSDWEDPWAVDLIAEQRLKPRFFKEWIAGKRESAGMFGFSKILLKSPYLSLHMPALRAVAPDAFVIQTKRNEIAIEASMVRHPMLSLDDQDKIMASRFLANHVFDTDRCQEDPRTEIQCLCMALGFDPGPDLEDAISLVEQKKAQVF